MCAPCQQKAAARSSLLTASETANPDCPYSYEQLLQWRSLLLCAKEQSLEVATGLELNSALGIVLASMNYKADPCYFKEQLQKTELIITLIINKQTCQ